MSLTAADVAEIVRLLEQSSFDELTLEINGMKLSLRRGETAARAAVPAQAAAAAVAPASTPAAVNAKPSAPADPSLHDLRSPLLGTFYRSPKPGAPPFVEPGTVVDEDTIVAIIEVMKLMNTVRAGVRGTVTEIFASDGALVEYDQTLLRIRKPG